MLSRLAFVILPLILGSCVQTENSNSQDKDTYSDIGGNPDFVASRAIFAQSCANCHLYHTMSEDQMVADGVLVKGDPASSKIYYRLTGSTSGPGTKNMPTGGALPVSDLNQIETWITNAN